MVERVNGSGAAGQTGAELMLFPNLLDTEVLEPMKRCYVSGAAVSLALGERLKERSLVIDVDEENIADVVHEVTSGKDARRAAIRLHTVIIDAENSNNMGSYDTREWSGRPVQTDKLNVCIKNRHLKPGKNRKYFMDSLVHESVHLRDVCQLGATKQRQFDKFGRVLVGVPILAGGSLAFISIYDRTFQQHGNDPILGGMALAGFTASWLMARTGGFFLSPMELPARIEGRKYRSDKRPLYTIRAADTMIDASSDTNETVE